MSILELHFPTLGSTLPSDHGYAPRSSATPNTPACMQPARLLRHSKLPHLVGVENVVAHVDAALVRANEV